jgi:tRNA pseudouridine synthase 10
MGVLEKALGMLKKYPLCDHCLGRQFALLGYGVENDERGKSIKMTLALEAQTLTLSERTEGVKVLKTLAINGFSDTARSVLRKMKKRIPSKTLPTTCFLCEGKFENLDNLLKKALDLQGNYDYSSFLVGIELPVAVEEREDELKAEFSVKHGEGMRNEFGRLLGKRIALSSGKEVDHKKPDLVFLVNPFTEAVRLQPNPLYIAGRYRKLVRNIPQSKWFCSNCRGKGCEKCNWTGKMYAESVEEIIAKPFLEATGGTKTSFHASGREDIDARMLGKGRPFVIEISKPRRRFLNLEDLETAVNNPASDKVGVSNLRFADKTVVRRLKKAEAAQKEYRVIMEFEKKITPKSVRLLEERLTNIVVRQRTPIRVSHRRADLTREKYIYEVNVKKLAPQKAEMKIRCQGGLYVKELVTGDEGRTTPNVSDILKNPAKPVKLDVLKVIVKD